MQVINADILLRRDMKWWLMVIIHNIILHPLLPIAYFLDYVVGLDLIPLWIYNLHHKTSVFPGNL